MKEKCWNIKEVRPIPVSICTENNKPIYISVAPMTMRYETWENLSANHRHQDIAVTIRSYDYEDGECLLIADDKKALYAWLKKYDDIIILDKSQIL